MKLQYLGTAAFEGIPALFCQCDACKEAAKRGGRNIRTRSQAVVDDSLLIDFPADTYSHYIKYNIPMWQIKTCLITHSHSDHLYPNDLETRMPGFSHISDPEPVTVYSAKASYDEINKINLSPSVVKTVLIKPFEPFEADGYTITALNAAHAPKTDPYIYLIEKGGKTLLYSNDTGIYPDDTWEYLRKFKKTIDLVSLDCTNCETPVNYFGHMGLPECIETRKKLYEIGVCTESTRFVLNHFSHNGKHSLYDDLLKTAEKENFDVSYDGMIVEF